MRPGVAVANVHVMFSPGMPITVNQSESLSLIRLDGEVDITSAVELKKVLLQTLGSGKPLRLEVGTVTDLDITTLQLLWAAARDARRSGSNFTLMGQIPKEIATVVADAGFETFPVSRETEQ